MKDSENRPSPDSFYDRLLRQAAVLMWEPLEIQCHNKEGIERYIIVENIITPISSPSCNGKTRDYLDEDSN